MYQEEKDGEDETTTYCWIESLYQRTAEIEEEGTQKPKLWLTKPKDMREFLESESCAEDSLGGTPTAAVETTALPIKSLTIGVPSL